jgi:pimeloyl-ACP methyl ester carboxylesterase
MLKRYTVVTLLVLMFAVLSVAFTQTPTPPLQPESGPGGKQHTHQAVIKNRYGSREKEYWIYEPDSPRPGSAPLVIFIHGWGGMNPLYYGAWIDHLVKRGNIVVYPRYQATLLTGREDFLPNTIAAINDAIKRLRSEPGHVRPDLSRVAVVGHSLGGLLAASTAAVAGENGIPRMRAVMSVEPGLTRSPANVPLADLKKIPADTLLLSVAGDRDTLVDDADAKRIYYESTQVSAANKDFIKLVSDDHGRPGLIASHRAPTSPDLNYDNGEGNRMRRSDGAGVAQDIGGQLPSGLMPEVNALDYYGVWKLFDALTDAAFYGKNREYALGNTSQQRFMGKWSDGVAVKELIVTDRP